MDHHAEGYWSIQGMNHHTDNQFLSLTGLQIILSLKYKSEIIESLFDMSATDVQ